jgi:hypothetical protein
VQCGQLLSRTSNEDKEQKVGGVNVTFSDLLHSVPLKKTAKDGTGTLQILDVLSGAFLPGRMTPSNLIESVI